MRNLKIDSTMDSELDQCVAETQPYNTVSVTVVTARSSVQREDGKASSTPTRTCRLFRPSFPARN